MKKTKMLKQMTSSCLIAAMLMTQSGVAQLSASVLDSRLIPANSITPYSVEQQVESVVEQIVLELAEGDTANAITADFTVPTQLEDGTAIDWETSNKDIVKVKKGAATITKPETGYLNATITATVGDEKKQFPLRILADGFYGFENAYVNVGDTLKAIGYPEGTTYTYKVYDISQANTSNATQTTDRPNRPGNFGGTQVDITKVTTDKTMVGEAIVNTTGELPIVEDYEEKMIELEVEGYDTISIYISDIPVMYITSETAYYDIIKAEYSDAEIQMQGSDAYNYGLYTGKTEIKTRGNSTAERPKRPFKIKLDKKTDLLGLGEEDNGESYKSKHWVLLANDIDHSLLRNKLLYDFSGAIGTEFYFHSTNVVLIYNGEYEGVYQLCEHRRVDEGRIEILQDPNNDNAYTDWEGIGETMAGVIAETEIAASAELQADEDAADDFTSALEEAFINDFSWIDTHKITLKEGTYGTVTIPEKTYNLSDYDLEVPATDGGYLVEMDFYSKNDPTYAAITTAFDQPLYISSPEPGSETEVTEEKVAIVNTLKNTSLYQQAFKLNQSFEYALHSDDFFFRNSAVKYQAPAEAMDSDGNYTPSAYEVADYQDDTHDGLHYSQMFDMDSLVTNFIFCEFAMNWDSMKNSFFYYKKSGELAKIGPQWDFDWCWGNTNMYSIDTYAPTTWQTTNANFSVEQYYQTQQWNRMLIRDPYFLTKVYEKYWAERDEMEKIVAANGLLESYAAEIATAAAANDNRWSYTYTEQFYGMQLMWGDWASAMDFTGSVNRMKNFLTTRMEWLDEQFASVDTLRRSLGYYKTSNKVSITGLEKTTNGVKVTAKVTDEQAASVEFQINGTTMENVKVSNGSATCEIQNADLLSASLNTVEAKIKDKSGSYLYTSKISGRQSYNMVMSNYVVFETDTLKTQTVVGEMKTEKPEYTLYVGDTLQLEASLQLDNSVTTDEATMESVNSQITSWATSDYYIASVVGGKVTAKKAGTVTITFSKAAGISGTCKVIVKEKQAVQNSTNTTNKTNTTVNKNTNTTVSKDTNTNKVTVKPAKNLKAKALKGKKVKLTWKKSSNAKGYYIYRATKKNGKYKKIATIKKKSKCTYTDKKLKANKKYFYKIKAYKIVDGKKITSKFTSVKFAKTKK